MIVNKKKKTDLKKEEPVIKAEKKKKKDDPSALVFVGIFMIGMGTGFLTGHVVPGVFFGLGFGFLALYLVKIMNISKE